MSKIKLLYDVVSDLKNLAASIQTLAESMDSGNSNTIPSGTTTKTDNTNENKITLEQVRAALAEKSYDGFTKEVRELIEKYGGKRLSDINPSKYPNLLKDAEGLK